MARRKIARVLKETDPHIPVPQQLAVALATLVLVFGITYIPEITAYFTPSTNELVPNGNAVQRQEVVETELVDPFEDVLVTGHAAYVWDVQAQRALFNKNADEQWPLASITKLMTALVAYELLESDAVINITADAIRQDGDSGLSDGEHFLLRNITDFTLMTSSNDAAYALAAAAGGVLTNAPDTAETFVDAMNIKAEEIGLSQTYFNNPTGLDLSKDEAGAYGSARDVTFLMEHIISKYPDVLELTGSEARSIINEDGEFHIAENTNYTIDAVPNLIASKTGYTDLAGGNLVIAFNAGLNRPIIISVLGSTFNDRFTDVALLAERAQAYIAMQK